MRSVTQTNPKDLSIDWLVTWQGAASAQAASAVLAQKGHVVVLAGLDAPELPPPTPQESNAAKSHPHACGFLIRRGIARAVAARHLAVSPADLAVGTDDRGAPLFPGSPLHLSFSARGSLGAIALGLAPLGVDLEIALPPAGIPFNLLNAHERAALEALPPPAREAAFLRLWRAKEASVKALGMGFALAPETICIEAEQAFVEARQAPLRLLEAPQAGLCLALA